MAKHVKPVGSTEKSPAQMAGEARKIPHLSASEYLTLRAVASRVKHKIEEWQIQSDFGEWTLVKAFGYKFTADKE